MEKRRILSFLAAALALSFAAQAIAGSSIPFTANYSGSATLALFSFDANFAGISTYGEAGTFGQATGRPARSYQPHPSQDVTETAPDGKTCTVSGHAANAGTEYTLVGDSDIVRYSSNGDLQYRQATSVTSCVDTSSGTPPFAFTDQGSGIIIGGTGRFAGASGNYSFSDSGSILSQPSSPGFGFFAGAQGTVSGVVNLH
jgi:hypothetical protein